MFANCLSYFVWGILEECLNEEKCPGPNFVSLRMISADLLRFFFEKEAGIRRISTEGIYKIWALILFSKFWIVSHKCCLRQLTRCRWIIVRRKGIFLPDIFYRSMNMLVKLQKKSRSFSIKTVSMEYLCTNESVLRILIPYFRKRSCFQVVSHFICYHDPV